MIPLRSLAPLAALPARQPAPLLAALLTPLLALTASAPGAERWAPPLGRALEVSGPYRAPVHDYASGHRGIDLPAVPGEAVLAPVSGTVSFAGPVVDRGVVSIRLDTDTVVSIEPVAAEVATGASVRRGERIGAVSSGGHCLAECVHVGVRVEGAYVNPMRFFANRPVLLPW
ncbi:M23 family metallopeptidase [Leucobacter ruminantium]|uniref:M23 family metallopeptidase n=1 Tax=Leucobacter ruminantium TaxID=1289170 RepID=A0A939LWQ0_9MICO|nr:M23 family metallopeptidase [Leucobacter ruminantium]MBO1806110.1 M23 family metallopeptidase [Leucobacter ruminantium]